MFQAFLWADGTLRTGVAPEAAAEALGRADLLWLDFEAPSAGEEAFLRRVFGRHPLAVDDCVSDSKVPKVNVYGDLVHMVIHGSSPPSETGALRTRELDLLWGGNFLVSWHRHPLRSVNALRERCLKEPETVLGRGPAQALYGILDVLVDNWFPFVESAARRLDGIEKRLTRRAQAATLEPLQGFHRELVTLIGVIDHQREVFDRLSREEVPFVSSGMRLYFRELYDRAVLLHGQLELHREQIRSVRETCLLLVSNDLNQVMKTLTVVTTVLMSMTVVTGVYGMNFRRMPELEWVWGYPLALGLMGAAGAGMYVWMRRRGWL